MIENQATNEIKFQSQAIMSKWLIKNFYLPSIK